VDFEIKQANHELSERWDKDIRSVRYEFGQAESNFPRFVDRVENACAAGLKSLQAVRDSSLARSLSGAIQLTATPTRVHSWRRISTSTTS